MVLWAKMLIAGGTGVVVGAGATAIGAKKYWKKRYDKENQFLIDKNAELKDAVNDQEALISSLKEDVAAMKQIITIGQKDIKVDTEPKDPEYVDYTKLHKPSVKDHAPEPVKHEKAYILSQEDLDKIDPEDVIRGVYYKGSDDYVGDDDVEPISKTEWQRKSPFCDIHDELRKAKSGSIVNIMTSVGLVYEVDIEDDAWVNCE